MVRALLALIFACALAHAEERLVFTTVTPGTSPVWISAPEQSKDFGFQSVSFLNDSGKPVQSIHLKVLFSLGGTEEEVVDAGYIFISLESGEQKRGDIFLARIEALNQKLKSMKRQVAWVKLTVESAEFEDGSRWDANAPTEDPLLRPKPL